MSQTANHNSSTFDHSTFLFSPIPAAQSADNINNASDKLLSEFLLDVKAFAKEYYELYGEKLNYMSL